MNQPPASVPASPQSTGNQTRGGKRPGAGRKSLDSKLTAAIVNAFGAFPSADRWAPGRTYIYAPVVEPNREHDSGTRLEIARKARALYNASGIAVRAIDGPARAAVGVGMVPRPATSSPAFNEAVTARFRQGPECDARFFDAARQVNYHEALDLVLRQAWVDGDVFWQKLRASDGSSRCRLVEGTFVGNVERTARGFDQDRWTDGALLDSLGGVSQWRVLNRPGGDAYTDVPADQLLQVKRTRRAGGVRGVSVLAIAANHIHDLQDIVSFTKAGYKLGSQFPFSITSERGAGVLGTIAASTDTTTGVETRTLQQRADAGAMLLKPGEKVEHHANPLPGETFSPFTMELRREIAEGVGAPYNVLYNLAEIGGANNRWVLVEYQFLLDEIQWMLISQFCRPWYLDWVWHEIEAGYIDVSIVPDDWWNVLFTTPAKPTVDNGRDGKLMLDQMKAKFLPDDYVHSLFGRDGAEMDALKLETLLRRRKLIDDANALIGPDGEPLTVEEVFEEHALAPAEAAVAEPVAE